MESFDTFVEKKKTVFRPDKYDLKPKVRGVEPIIQEPPITISPIEITLPIKEEPILIKPTPEPIMIQPAPEPISTPSSGGGGGSIYREYDTLDRQNLADGGMGRERMEFT